MKSIDIVIDDALVHTDDTLDEDSDSDNAICGDVEKEKNKKRDGAVT